MRQLTPSELQEYSAVVRSMITDENTLINARMGWLLTLQGLLLAGLSFVWRQHWALTVVLSVVGLSVSFSLGFYLRCSLRALDDLAGHWAEIAKDHNYVGPPVIGLGHEEVPRLAHLLLPWYLVPAILFVAWVAILVLRFTVAA